MFRDPETGKWGSRHLLKDCKKARKIYRAFARLVPQNGQHDNQVAPAAQPGVQLALQAPPAPVANPAQAALAFYPQQQQQPQQQPQDPANVFPAARGQINMIQKGRPSNRTQKIITRQVYQAITNPPAVPDYLRGSETAITFSRRTTRRRYHDPGTPLW